MGWSIHYDIKFGKKLTAADEAWIRAHEARTNKLLSEASEGFSLSKGFTKPSTGRKAGADYAVIVEAVLEVVGHFPRATATISDDYYLPEATDVTEVDIAELRSRVESPDSDEEDEDGDDLLSLPEQPAEVIEANAKIMELLKSGKSPRELQKELTSTLSNIFATLSSDPPKKPRKK